MMQTLFDKLNFKYEKNILLQGLPIHIEGCFKKLRYAKNVTPLLRKNKIDFACLFSIDKAQLERIVVEVLVNLADDGKLWVIYPRPGSKIFSNLHSYEAWHFLRARDYHLVRTVDVDHSYNGALYATNQTATDMLIFNDTEQDNPFSYEEETPQDLQTLFEEFTDAAYYFQTLSTPYKRQFLFWIETAPDISIRRDRIQAMIEKLLDGNYNLQLG